MSLLARLFRAQDQAGLPEALALDLARLKKVAATLGETRATLGLKGLSRSEQLQRLNQRLGERLGGSTPWERAALMGVFASADNLLPEEVRRPSSSASTSEVKIMIENGCAELGRTLSDGQIQTIHAHLKSKPVMLCHDAHIGAERVATLSEVPADKSYACYEYLDLWSSPHVVELATHDRFLDLAQAYLGCTPTLYSMNAFWSLPNREPHPYSQVFHRDWEDYRSLVIFTLLTPVEVLDEGAQFYVETSHEAERFETLLRKQEVYGRDVVSLLGRDGVSIAPVAMKLFQSTARAFFGPAGYSFCGDAYGLHRAVVPHSRPRLLLWFRFGNFFNETMYRMSLRTIDRAAAQRVSQRIPVTPRHQYVFRYMLDALARV